METSIIRRNGATEDKLLGLLAQLDRKKIRVADIEKAHINGVLHKSFKGRSVVEPDSKALSRWGYFAPNAQKRITVLVVDDDNQFDGTKFARLGLSPNWVAINESNLHAQYVFYLKKPVYGPADAKPVRYFNHVARGLSFTLDGDPHFSRGLSRNPFFTNHPYVFHHQHDAQFTLGQLRSVIPADVDVSFTQELATLEDHEPGRARPFTYIDEAGLFHRRMFVFDQARIPAYRLRAQGLTLRVQDVMPLLLDAAAEANLKMKAIGDTRGLLPRKDLEARAAAIARWINANMKPGVTRFTAEQRRKGGATAGRRNLLNAHWTEQWDKGRSLGRQAASDNAGTRRERAVALFLDGLTVQAIADDLRVDRRTVSKYLQGWK